MAVAVAVAVSGGGAVPVPVPVPVAGLTKRFFITSKRFLNQCLMLVSGGVEATTMKATTAETTIGGEPFVCVKYFW